MREIKFRCVNKRTNEVVYSDDLYWFEENLVHVNGDNDWLIEQYTGHDKWFQNDIVRTDHFKDIKKKQHYLYHQIVWSEKYLCWYAANCGNKDGFNELDHGNIQLWVFIKNAVNPVISGKTHEVKS